MAFDIEAAKKAGYSDAEIADYLNKKQSAPETPKEASPMDSLKALTKQAISLTPLGAMNQVRDIVHEGADFGGEMAATGLAKAGANPNAAALVGTGIQMIPNAVEAFAGSMGANKAAQGIEASGPLTAAIKDPSIIAPGTVKTATNALQSTKEALKASVDSGELARLRELLTKNPVKLGNEVIKKLDSGADIAPGQAIYYRNALNAMKQKGGEIASDAYKYLPKLDAQLKESAPQLMDKIKKISELGRADLLDGKAFPWLTTIEAAKLGPAALATRLAATSGGSRAIGAGIGMGLRLTPAVATNEDGLVKALKMLSDKRKQAR